MVAASLPAARGGRWVECKICMRLTRTGGAPMTKEVAEREAARSMGFFRIIECINGRGWHLELTSEE